MKFKNISQFTQKGNWECNFSFKGLIDYIEKFKQGIDCEVPLQMNPDFQRGHVWTEQQSIGFIEAILQGGAKNARVIYLNDPNWNEDCQTGYNDFVCVDGLQRYTAIKQFIDNQIKVFGYYYNEYEDRNYLNLHHTMRLNINDLRNKKDVLTWYIQMNEGGTPHSTEEINRVKQMLVNNK